MTNGSGGQPNATPAPTAGSAADRRRRAANADAVRSLLRLADGRTPDASLLRDALRCAGTELGAVFALIKASHRGATIDDYFHTGAHDPQFWKEPAGRALTQSLAVGQSVDQRYRAKGGGLRLAIIAAPIRDDAPEPIGGISIVIEVSEEAEIERARIELRAFATMLAMLMRPRAVVRDAGGGGGELRTAAIAASGSSKATVAIAMTNQLRAKLGCEQVAIGTVHRKLVRIASISGFADISERTPGAQAIRGAMEECFDLGRAVVVCATRADGDACPLHRHWSAEAEGAFVATIPLRIGGKPDSPIEAVLALRHAPGRTFSDEDIRKISESVAPYAAGLRVAELASRSLLAHATDSVIRHVAGIRHPRGAIRLSLTILGCALLAWCCFGTMSHTVSASAEIAPVLVREMTAPFESRLLSSEVTEGDEVRAGDVLFTLDTAQLEVERQRLLASIHATEVEAEQARGEGDHAHARLMTARGDVDRASLAATERRIAEAVVRAPSDGVILRGDLRERIGVAVASGESLLEFVPAGALRVLIEIPERDVLHVAEGAHAEFRPQARPEMTIGLRVDRIRPAAEVRNAENVFVAEATLERVEPWMRAGVEGAVRVDAGEGPVWWTLFHRLIDAVRLRLWV